MPDTLSLTAGVSLGLLAGIVSGVCYLYANGLAWSGECDQRKRCSKSSREYICRRCGGDTTGGFVPCICNSRSQEAKFESGAWFLRQVQQALSLMPWSISTEKLEQIDEENDDRDGPGPSELAHKELRTIREFLETLSGKLAGGHLERTRIGPLYDHPAYVLMFERHHSALRITLTQLAIALRDALTHLPSRNASPSSTSSGHHSGATTAHVQLKRLVARVVEEAAALPALTRYASEPPHSPSVESSTYEDLLATAILNKVIERYQNESGSGGRSSGIHSASASPTPSERSSPRSLNSRSTRDVTTPLREEDDVSDWEHGEPTDDVTEVSHRVPFPEYGRDIIHNSDNSERDFDEVSGSDLQAVDGTWEENWLFQKKKIKTVQSVPVPMLVPNSNAEYRALIGDRDADDTTDLSDYTSDAEDEPEFTSDIKRTLHSKHVIGGKLKLDETLDFEPDSLTIIDDEVFEEPVEGIKQNEKALNSMLDEINDNNVCVVETSTIVDKNEIDGVDRDEIDGAKDSVLVIGIESGPLPKAEFNLKEEIHRTPVNGYGKENVDVEFNDEVGNEYLDSLQNQGSINTLNHHEREGEYEETVTLPVQRYADSLRRKHFENGHREMPTRDVDQQEDLIPGSIAYRERQKWLNYVEMPNNPYSPEAIQKRLSSKSASSLFDTITRKTRDLEDHNEERDVRATSDASIVEEKRSASLNASAENVNRTDRRTKSPSPRILKDVLADDIPQYKRYGRDYYIREAKTSAGGRLGHSDTSSASSVSKWTGVESSDPGSASPGLLIKQFNLIATNQQYTKFNKERPIESITTMTNNNNNTDILIEYDDANEQTLFAAEPVAVDEDTDKKFEEIIQTAYETRDIEKDQPLKSPASVDDSYISTSSVEDSIKIYNVQTGEIMKCKPEDSLSARYGTDCNDNVDNEISREADSSSPCRDLDEDTSSQKEPRYIDELDEVLPHLPKVKELAKKFVSMENLSEPVKVPQPYSRRRRSKENILKDTQTKQVYMHSLTARSISKEFRDELKLSMPTPITVPGGSKEIPEGTEEVTKESSRPGSPMPEPGTLKNKLAFFESLKNKFSNK
ncbi:uncharacterized protein LOC114251898 isoform X3 [Bombyx mandarina]|uniref:Uncharacterized protein LOC114251898 isoform X3 n=1 Tax=Bombyx mandarina TaxID=7092 RepID=A0A6J2KPT1_BOMMA|nr:uncharacterized protein LOC114251898 isoform X3 [Bombyx mandarina]